jgi:hypothetical protein
MGATMNVRLALASAALFAASSSVAVAREDQIILLGNVSGKQTVSADATSAEYSYNDRGRGDHITASWKLDAAGVITDYTGSGNDYMKVSVDESFHMSGG